jgi:hypothetical protein
MNKSWSEAAALMRQALAILDETEAPAEVGAHLDLAIARLREHLGSAGADDPGRKGVAGRLRN